MPRAERNLAPLSLLVAWAVVGCAGSQRAPSSVPAHPAPETPSSSVTTGRGIYHTVLPGQTLWRIATAYDRTVEELALVNDIDDPTRLSVGQRLFIPGAPQRLDVPAYPAAPGASARAGEWSWPLSDGRVLSYFGATRRSHRHSGLDIGGQRGERVKAAQDGVVVYSGSSMRGYGKTIILDHGNGLTSLYAHNSALLVQRGQRVARGQPIARVGRTGNATTEHCHFEIRKNDVAVDPLRYLAPAREARP